MWGGWVDAARDPPRGSDRPGAARRACTGSSAWTSTTGLVHAHGLLAATPMSRIREAVEAFVADAGAGAGRARGGRGRGLGRPRSGRARPAGDRPCGPARGASARGSDSSPSPPATTATRRSGRSSRSGSPASSRPSPAPTTASRTSPRRIPCSGCASGSACPPDRTAVVGDSPADLRMGRAAGVARTIAVLTGVGDRADARAARGRRPALDRGARAGLTRRSRAGAVRGSSRCARVTRARFRAEMTAGGRGRYSIPIAPVRAATYGACIAGACPHHRKHVPVPQESAKPDGPRCAARPGRRADHAVRGCPAGGSASRHRPVLVRARRSALDEARPEAGAAPPASRPRAPDRGRGTAARSRAVARSCASSAGRTPFADSPRSCPARTPSSPSSRRSSTTRSACSMRIAPASGCGSRSWTIRSSSSRAASSPPRSRSASAPRPRTPSSPGFEALRRETVLVFRDADDSAAHAGDARAVRGVRHQVAVLRARGLPRRSAGPARPVPRGAVRLDPRRDRAGAELRRHDRDRHRQRPAHGVGGGSRGAAARRSRTCRRACPRSRTCAGSARRSSSRRARSSPTTRSGCTASTTTRAGASRSPSRARSWAGSDPEPELLRVRIGEGLTGWVAEHGEPLLIGDAHADARSLVVGEHASARNRCSSCPMTYEGRVRGHRRRVAPRQGSVRAGRRDDAEHLCRHGRPGARERGAAGAAPHAAGRARAPARQPAPAHGRQRAAPVDPRPVGRPRDDRGLAEDGGRRTTR